MHYSVTFPTGTVDYYFQEEVAILQGKYSLNNTIIITDDHIAGLQAGFLSSYNTIIIPTGEESKTIATIETVTNRLLQLECHRKTTLIGMGGGVITDITGFVASIYMRGISFGFIPTTLLGMVDAAIGGKNGVNIGLHKNIAGTINQPAFIYYYTDFLKTLPDEEWSNGFAEIIKYACLFDAGLFEELSKNDLQYYQQNSAALESMVTKCAAWKNKIVAGDEKETGERKLLNFGHTAGHALENLYHLPHGHAVAIGMYIACKLSEKVMRLDKRITGKLETILTKYNLPTHIQFDAAQVMELLKMDKKRNHDTIDYILLTDIGAAHIKPLSFDVIYHTLLSVADAGSN